MRKLFLQKYTLLCILGLLCLSFLTMRSLFLPGFFPMHDDTQPSRVYEMERALYDGMFPVRWSEDLGYGYGYPIFNFYAPLVYYIGAAFSVLGVDALLATKIVIASGLALSGIGMYFFARQLWGNSGGFLSGVLYLLVPYHAINIYVRGDLAEFWASVFIPFVLWGIWGIFRYDKRRYGALTSVSLAAVVISHNLTALMLMPFLIAYISALWMIAKVEKEAFPLRNIILSLVTAVLLSAFYWLPVLTEMRYTNVLSQVGGKAAYALHFVCPPQLWDSPWGFGGSAPGCIDGMSYRLGKLHIVLSLVSLIGLFFVVRKEKKAFFLGITSAFGLYISLLLCLDWSKPMWQIIPGMSFFQYPWRFLLMAAVFSSFLSGALPWLLQIKLSRRNLHRVSSLCTLVVLSGAAVFLYGKLFMPQTIVHKEAADYTSIKELRWTISKISDEYLPKGFKKTESAADVVNNKLVILQGDATVSNQQQKTGSYTADVTATSPSIMQLRTAYFPAWQLQLNKHPVHYTITNSGLLFPIPQGNYTFSANFVQTPMEKLANLLSLAGIAILFLGIIRIRGPQAEGIHHADKEKKR